MTTARSVRPASRALAFAIAALLVLPGLAAADSVAPTGADVVVVGVQPTIDLGDVAPSSVINLLVLFTLTCGNGSHVDPGQTVNLDYAGGIQPDGGLIVAVSGGTVGPAPADWPADVPVYPGGKIHMVSATSGVRTVVFTSVDPPGKLTTFYKTNLPGWTATMDLTGPDGGIAQKKKGKNGLTLNITKSEDGSAGVSLSVGPS